MNEWVSRRESLCVLYGCESEMSCTTINSVWSAFSVMKNIGCECEAEEVRAVHILDEQKSDASAVLQFLKRI